MNNRDFKGVWIPKEIWLRKDLNALDKMIFAEIDSLDNENHCTAGNEYFAEFCQCSESKVTKTVKKLIDLGLVEQIHFDGRHRKLRVVKNTIESSKIYEAEPEKIRANNTSNKTNSNKLFISKDINNSQNLMSFKSFIELYNSICVSLPKAIKLTDKRRIAILNIIKKYSYEDIKQVFINLENSDFCKGKNGTGWKADLDFVLREDKFVATLEGKYNSNTKSNKKLEVFGESDDVSNEQYTDEELAELEKLNAERRANGQRTHF